MMEISYLERQKKNNNFALCKIEAGSSSTDKKEMSVDIEVKAEMKS